MEFEEFRSNKIGYFYTVSNHNINFHLHAHRSFELIAVRQGKIRCEISGQKFAIGAGEGALIFPGQIHAYQTVSSSDSVLFIFSSDWVERFYEDVRGTHFEIPVCKDIDERWIQTLQRKDVNQYLRKAVLYEICGRFYDCCKLIETNEAEFALTNAIAFYIQDHYHQRITLMDMARDMGYNYSYLSSFFNRCFGDGFSRYLNRFRLEYAVHYLTHTDKSITEISDLCGFDTIRNFNRLFREEFQTTPRAFRKEAQTFQRAGESPD